MHDAHTHINDSQFINNLREKNFPCIINACNKKEFDFLKEYQYPNMKISCGIHPWYIQTTNLEETLNCINEADFLGEIGLDQPWCDTPFELQKQIFIRQLQLHNKTTILHTKGYEKEVLDIIRLFPRKYLVHWYSCQEYLEDYIALECFFTVGPSVLVDDEYKKIVKKIPINRLLVETDGLEAIEWAISKSVNDSQYEMIILEMIEEISALKNISKNELISILSNNFNALTCN